MVKIGKNGSKWAKIVRFATDLVKIGVRFGHIRSNFVTFGNVWSKSVRFRASHKLFLERAIIASCELFLERAIIASCELFLL